MRFRALKAEIDDGELKATRRTVNANAQAFVRLSDLSGFASSHTGKEWDWLREFCQRWSAVRGEILSDHNNSQKSEIDQQRLPAIAEAKIKRSRCSNEARDDELREQLHKINTVAKALGAHFPIGVGKARSLASSIVNNRLIELSFDTVRKVIGGKYGPAKRLAREGLIEPFWEGLSSAKKLTRPAKSTEGRGSMDELG
jgi:hypothetical protein